MSFYIYFPGDPVVLIFESSRWLAARGRYPEAKRSLARARGIPDHEVDDNWKIHREVRPFCFTVFCGTDILAVGHQLVDMQSALEHESAVRAGWIDCFRPEGKLLYRTLLVMTLQMFQQLTGANYFFYVRSLTLGYINPILIELVT